MRYISFVGFFIFQNLLICSFSEAKTDSQVPTTHSGQEYSCLLTNGKVNCWGANVDADSDSYDRSNVFAPKDLGYVKILSIKNLVNCAITESETRCWGATEAPISIPVDAHDLNELAVGTSHACGLSSRGVICWSWPDSNPALDVPKDLGNVHMISSGRNFSCAVTDTGVRCWGDCGFDNRDCRKTPTNLGQITSISSGEFITCVTATAGVSCWGYQYNDIPEFQVPKDLGVASTVVAGKEHFCAITKKGVRCWGSNENGQINVPSDLGAVFSVSVGSSHSCAMTSKGERCWGDNSHGELITPNISNNFTTIAAEDSRACGILKNKRVICWGYQSGGHDATNVPPPDIIDASLIALGSNHTCVKTLKGIKCWGDNSQNQLKVPLNLGEVSEIKASNHYTCAKTKSGLDCWGKVPWPQDQAPPKNLAGITWFETGTYSTCAVANEKSYCWGFNSFYSNHSPPADLGTVPMIVPDNGDDGTVCAPVVGRIRCWSTGQVQEPISIFPANFPGEFLTVRSVFISSKDGCAITDKGATCFGPNKNILSILPTQDVGDVTTIHSLQAVTTTKGVYLNYYKSRHIWTSFN